MKSRSRPLAIFLLLALATALAPLAQAQRERLSPEDLDIVNKRWPNAKRTFTCLRYVIVKPGDAKGPTPGPGMVVETLFKGMLLNGKVFDQALDPQHPLRMRLGRGTLIDGWEEALQKMHRGEKWILIVPSELGYGYRGRPPDIPPQATLVFELELLDFNKG